MIRWVRLLFVAFLSLCVVASVQAAGQPNVELLTVQAVINPVVADYVSQRIAAANDDGAAAIVIKLDTPGGLDSSMRQIIQSMIASKAPVIVWVAPEGGRAASAGTFITMAAHIAVMAPNTSIGAAHPVGSGGEDVQGDERDKVTNDAVSYLRDIATRRGRNADWADKAIRDSISANSQEAEQLNVVDFVSGDLGDILNKIDGRTVTTAAGPVTLRTAGDQVTEAPMDFIERLLLIITDPTIAALLLSLGGIALYFELSNPGAILPGVVGGIAILLALYALGTLPVNLAGLGLIGFAFALFLADVYLTSHGVLTVGGAISLALGLLMLINSSAPYLQVARPAVAGIVTAFLAASVVIATLSFRTRRIRVATGSEALVGRIARARSAISPDGTVMLDGEIWRAVTDRPVEQGAAVRVVSVEGLTVKVEPVAK
jgi:membrane-bound serine protease (ClpP class)